MRTALDTTGSVTTVLAGVASPGRRSDAGAVRLTDREGLAAMRGDVRRALLPAGRFPGRRDERLRGIVARWRRSGYVATGRLRPGPAWCWLTRSGLAVTGQHYAPARPALARLAHIRAVLAVRLSLEASDAYQDGRAWWRSERRIRAAAGGRVGGGHVPDAEMSWPDLTAGAYAGQCWAIEAELTPKPLARTAAIMAGLLARSGSAHEQFPDIGIPRDGGLADLLAEAAGSAPGVRRGDLRGHRTLRPRHLLRAATRERADPGWHPAVRLR